MLILLKELTINKATFADDLIKDVKFMSNNSLKELTVKINPGNLGEITIKLVQEDGVMKANLKANSKETTALLSQNLAEIKKQISEQNIKIEMLILNFIKMIQRSLVGKVLIATFTRTTKK